MGLPKAYIPYIYLAIAVTGWALQPIVVKLLVHDYTELQITFYMMFFGTLGLIAITALERRLSDITRYTRDKFAVMAFLSFVGIFAYNLFYVYGFRFMSSSEANLINYLWPVFTTILQFPS